MEGGQNVVKIGMGGGSAVVRGAVGEGGRKQK